MNFKLCFVFILSFPCLCLGQTFNGQGGLLFPPTGTIGMTSSIASVSGIGILGGCNTIEKVTVDLTHTWDGDIALFLIAPDGTFLELSSANGGSNDNYQITVFRDDAPTFITAGAPPYNGNFRPEGRQNTSILNPYSNANPLGTFTFVNTFTGINADGDWVLFLNDWVGADSGILNAWSITFTNGGSITADAGPDLSVCGGTQTLTATASPSGSYTYSWSNNTSTSMTVVPPSSISTAPTQTTTYVVTVSDGNGCSGTDEVSVIITSAPDPGIVNIQADPNLICIGSNASLNFTAGVNNNWIFNITAANGSGNTNFNVNVFGTFGTISVSPVETTQYTVTSVIDQATGCEFVLSNPPNTTITVVPNNVNANFLPIPELCLGQSINIADFVTLLNGTTMTVHTSSPPTSFNEINSVVSPSNSTSYVLLLQNGPCSEEYTVDINVNAIQQPILFDATICENQFIDLFTLLNPIVAGNFNGPNVNANTFIASTSGSYSITFIPDDVCLSAITNTITVDPLVIPILGTTSLCAFDPPLDLNTLEDPNYPTGTWLGQGVNGTFFDPNNLSGDILLTFISFDDCVETANTIISVMAPTEVQLGTATLCETDAVFDLTTLEFPIVDGTWFGNGVNGNNFDPSGLSGNVQLTFTPDGECAVNTNTSINVNTLVTPFMIGTDVCTSENAFDLSILEDPMYPNGSWSGPGVFGHFYDATSQVGEVILSYSPIQSCVLPIDVVINNIVPATPLLSTADICEASGNFDLSTLQDPNFINGIWSGTGVAGNNFNPYNLIGLNMLSFAPLDYCVNPSTTSIFVETAGTPFLGGTSMCSTASPLDLTTLEDSNYPNGTWSGNGVSLNFFDPSAQSGDVILEYIGTGCVFPVTTLLNVIEPGTPVLANDEICDNAAEYNLSNLLDQNFLNGTWTGDGVSGTIFDPTGLNGNVPLVFTPENACDNSASTYITVALAPKIENFEVVCDLVTQTYTVAFDIIEGNSDTYLVNGTPAGSSFVSSPFPSQSNYSFTITDGNNCAPIILQGSKNCSCNTNAGTMEIAPNIHNVCVNETYTATHLGNQTLDQDTFLFVLHDNPNPSLGNVLAVNNKPQFGFPINGTLNTIYYISAVAGNPQGAFVDVDDPCLSVSSGTPIQFYKIGAMLDGPSTICINDVITLHCTLTGIPPFKTILKYSNGTKELIDTITNNTSNFVTDFIPTTSNFKEGQVKVEVIQLEDINCIDVGNITSYTFEITPERKSNINSTLCKGDSLNINGIIYNENHPSGTEIIPSNTSGQCDSIVQINLSYLQPAINEFKINACKGQYFELNGKIYDEANPVGMETIKNGAVNGCDSIINIDITYGDLISKYYQPTICKKESVTIGGNVYDINHISDTITILGTGSDCDTIAYINLNIKPDQILNFNDIICENEKIIINGIEYGKNHPSGTETIEYGAENGCDSIVNISLTILDNIVTNYNQEICKNDSIVVNGNIYHANKLQGVEKLTGSASNGCDSIVNINLTLIPDAISRVDTILCNEDSVIILGQKFDRLNPNGVITLPNSSQFGCDSFINVGILFYPIRVDTIRKTVAPSDSFVIADKIFNIANPEGLVEFSISSILGCDSVAYVILSFVKQAFEEVSILEVDEKCVGANNGTITIEEGNGCSDLQLKVNDDLYMIDHLPFTLENLMPGIYEVQLSGKEGCFYEKLIEIKEALPLDFVISNKEITVVKGKEHSIELIINPKVNNVEWIPDTYLSCSTCINTTFLNPQEDQNYTLVLEDENACVQMVEFKLNVIEPIIEIEFPNILDLSSNANNTWVAYSNESYQLTSLKIYDRWGSKIYHTMAENGTISWDGKLNTKSINQGVYVYSVEAIDKFGQSKTYYGDITVIE